MRPLLLWAAGFVALAALLVMSIYMGNAAAFILCLAAMAAFFALLLAPWRVPAWTWITSTSVASLSVVLSASGAAGGLAFHLVHNHGALYMCDFHQVKVLESYGASATPTPTPAATPTPSEAPSPPAAANGRKEEKAPSPPAAASASAGRVARDELKSALVEKHVFDLGFLSDLLVGMIAANALHLAISGIVRYNDTDQTGRNNVYFTLIALGILAGFSGANVLPLWADRLLSPEQQKQIAGQVADNLARDPVQRKAVAAQVTADLAQDPTTANQIVTKALNGPDSLKLIQQIQDGKKTDEPPTQAAPDPAASASVAPAPSIAPADSPTVAETPAPER